MNPEQRVTHVIEKIQNEMLKSFFRCIHKNDIITLTGIEENVKIVLEMEQKINGHSCPPII